jgi:hypothetical protein
MQDEENSKAAAILLSAAGEKEINCASDNILEQERCFSNKTEVCPRRFCLVNLS